MISCCQHNMMSTATAHSCLIDQQSWQKLVIGFLSITTTATKNYRKRWQQPSIPLLTSLNMTSHLLDNEGLIPIQALMSFVYHLTNVRGHRGTQRVCIMRETEKESKHWCKQCRRVRIEAISLPLWLVCQKMSNRLCGLYLATKHWQ